MKNTKIIYCDCDGVLTDNKFWISTKGEVSKGFNTRDVRAIRELIANGYEFYIIADEEWAGSKEFEERTGAVIMIGRDKSTLDLTDAIVLGDDSWDISMLKKCKYAFVPSDTPVYVLKESGCAINKLITKGGSGVVAELAKLLLK